MCTYQYPLNHFRLNHLVVDCLSVYPMALYMFVSLCRTYIPYLGFCVYPVRGSCVSLSCSATNYVAQQVPKFMLGDHPLHLLWGIELLMYACKVALLYYVCGWLKFTNLMRI